ncbi:MAG TPA: hypothetical protein VEL74_12420 [Thermoanaerobaculia bacterium]|nr:hypothetical protein [Thermoanaerobaculia bacterium]
MSDETTQTGRVGDWLRLGEVMESNTAELSHLEPFRVRLTEMTRDVRELFKEQAALKASKQDVSKRLDVLLREGDRLATLIRQALRQHYGIRSEKLTEFGLQPFRGRKPRTKKRSTVAPAPEAAAPIDPS